MVFHDTSKGAVNEEVVLDNARNGDDVVMRIKMLIGIMNWCTLKLQREKRIKKLWLI